MINHWNCELCKCYNDILNISCSTCHAHKPTWITSEYQARIEIKRDVWFWRINLDGVIMNESEIRAIISSIKILPLSRLEEIAQGIPEDTEDKGELSLLVKIQAEISRRQLGESIILDKMAGKKMTEQEELFNKFYNETKILVKDMDDIALREHRDGLRKIAFEAKARAIAADDEDRDRKAKISKKDWILSPTHIDSSDAINAVKIRQARMSKLDKTRKQLLAAGIDEDTVNEMVRGLEKNATEKQLKAVSFPPAPKPIEPIVEIEKKPNPFQKYVKDNDGVQG